MLYVFKPFWSLLTKGGEAYELIVFKRVHRGGCFIYFAKCLQLSLLIHLVLWVVTLKLDGRLLHFLSTMWCDDKFRMCDDKSRTKSYCRRPFFIMHVIIFVLSNHAWWIVFISWRGSPQVQPAMCICIPKANYLYAHLQGEPFQLHEANDHIL